MGEERLPGRVMLGEMLGGKGYSGVQEWDWMKDLEEDLKAGGQEWDWMKNLEEDLMAFGTRPHRRSADGSDGSRKGRRSSCGNGTRMTRRQRQNDTERLQPRL